MEGRIERRMETIKAIVIKIFNKRYKIDTSKDSKFKYVCDGRIIRCFADEAPKKTYCAAYVFDGLKK